MRASETEATVSAGERSAVSAVRGYGPVVACVTLLLVALAAFQLIGTFSRQGIEGHRRYDVATSQDGFRLLQDLGVKGRILVLFDKSGHIRERTQQEYVRAMEGHLPTAPVTPDDYIAGLLAVGVAREVYVVLPEEDWAAMKASWSPRGDFIVEEKRLVGRLHGAPVTYLTPGGLPRFGETVIAYVPRVEGLAYPEGLLESFDSADVCDIYIAQEGR